MRKGREVTSSGGFSLSTPPTALLSCFPLLISPCDIISLFPTLVPCFVPLHHLSVSVCLAVPCCWCDLHLPPFFLYYICALLSRTVGEAKNVTGRMHACVCAKTHRAYCTVKCMLPREKTRDWTDEIDCVVFGDKCNICLRGICWGKHKLPVIASCLVAISVPVFYFLSKNSLAWYFSAFLTALSEFLILPIFLGSR